MNLTKDDLEILCGIAKKAALSAGEIISNAQGTAIKVNHKEAGENIASCVVTQIDLKAQDAILLELNPTLAQYDLGLLTEESTDDNSRLVKDYFWCIDPLDGTLAFSKNEDGYSTAIALVSKSGEAIIGVVYNPRTNDLYSAIKGHGSYKNNKTFKVNNESEDLTLLYDQSFLKIKNFDLEMESLRMNAQSFGLREIKLHHLGGAIMNGISTIELAPAIYYKHPKEALGGGSIWDFAASSIIQKEAGGHNSDYFYNPLDFNNPNTTFMNQKGSIFSTSETIAKLIIPT